MDKALILIDVQNDFVKGGSLAVPNSHHVVPLINHLMPQFSRVIATQDWHPADHVSFTGVSPEGIWPVHCVQNTRGAQLAEGLAVEQIEKVFLKGTDPSIDSYSAFFDNQRIHSTGLAAYLHQEGLDELYFAGLVTDVCILYSVLDALALNFKVSVICDACCAIKDEEGALQKMSERGAQLLFSQDIGKQ